MVCSFLEPLPWERGPVKGPNGLELTTPFWEAEHSRAPELQENRRGPHADLCPTGQLDVCNLATRKHSGPRVGVSERFLSRVSQYLGLFRSYGLCHNCSPVLYKSSHSERRGLAVFYPNLIYRTAVSGVRSAGCHSRGPCLCSSPFPCLHLGPPYSV